MAVDWLAIRNDYINGGGSYRKLAEKYGVKFASLRACAKREDWPKLREEQQHKISTKAAQETQNKIAGALSDEASKKVKLRTGLLDMALKWLEDNRSGITDTGDFRRMVQSCLDLGVMDTQSGEEIENDGLMDALDKIAGNVFDDGDDSGMLPKEKDE